MNANAQKLSGFGGRHVDQTASILARQGQCLQVEFHPYFKTDQVKLPNSVEFVAHNALVPTKILELEEQKYNKRSVECRFVVAAIAVKAGLVDQFTSCHLKTFDEIMVAKSLDSEQMLDLIKEVFERNKDYKKQEIQTEFANDQDPFMLVKDLPFSESVKEKDYQFSLYRRALHILNE